MDLVEASISNRVKASKPIIVSRECNKLGIKYSWFKAHLSLNYPIIQRHFDNDAESLDAVYTARFFNDLNAPQAFLVGDSVREYNTLQLGNWVECNYDGIVEVSVNPYSIIHVRVLGNKCWAWSMEARHSESSPLGDAIILRSFKIINDDEYLRFPLKLREC